MIRVTSGPAVEPVTLDEIKLHCRIDHNDEDDYLTSLIAAARQFCETFTGQSFITQTLEYDLQKWPSGRVIHLPRPPVQTIGEVKYVDEDGVDVPLIAGDDYLADTDSILARVVLPTGKTWPTETMYPVNPIVVTFTAGYGLAIAVPEYIKAAIKLLVAVYYENRENVLPAGHVGKTLPMGIDALLWQHRTFWTPELNK